MLSLVIAKVADKIQKETKTIVLLPNELYGRDCSEGKSFPWPYNPLRTTKDWRISAQGRHTHRTVRFLAGTRTHSQHERDKVRFPVIVSSKARRKVSALGRRPHDWRQRLEKRGGREGGEGQRRSGNSGGRRSFSDYSKRKTEARLETPTNTESLVDIIRSLQSSPLVNR